ncbi:HIT domain-containing protein [Patescibacteria group bacterium]|nr:HIT domain-containing protein [Patescibacteria group bacterium]
MKDCIFCKIGRGEMGTEFLYEDNLCMIFRDINPVAKTHLLIVPRKHISTIADLHDDDAGLVGHMTICARDIAKKLNLEGYKLVFNVGRSAGQIVFHVHMHLISNS